MIVFVCVICYALVALGYNIFGLTSARNCVFVMKFN